MYLAVSINIFQIMKINLIWGLLFPEFHFWLKRVKFIPFILYYHCLPTVFPGDAVIIRKYYFGNIYAFWSGFF